METYINSLLDHSTANQVALQVFWTRVSSDMYSEYPPSLFGCPLCCRGDNHLQRVSTASKRTILPGNKVEIVIFGLRESDTLAVTAIKSFGIL